MVFGAYWDYCKNYVFDHNLIWGVPTPIQITQAFDNDKTKINNLLIYNNTAETNDATWSSAFGSALDNGSVVQNNVFRAAGFRMPKGTLVLRRPNYGTGAVASKNNLIWGVPPAPGWTEGIPIPGDIYADNPGFVNADGGESHLDSGLTRRGWHRECRPAHPGRSYYTRLQRQDFWKGNGPWRFRAWRRGLEGGLHTRPRPPTAGVNG